MDKTVQTIPISYNRRKKKNLFVVDIKQRVKGNLQCSHDKHCKGDSAFSHDVMAAILVF